MHIYKIRRNEETAKIQGNRNPFIDYPEMVEHIWGDKKETDIVLPTKEEMLKVSKDYKAGKTPVVYDFSERHMEYATSQSFLNNATNPVGFNLIKGIDSKPPINLEQFDNGKYIKIYRKFI